jgi:siderophore synthetase component
VSGAAVPPAAAEEDLVRRVLDALLREDFRGLLSRSRTLHVPALDDGRWLCLDVAAGALLLPVRPSRFLCDHTVRRGVLGRRTAAGTVVLDRLRDVLTALRPTGDREAEAGFASFTAECGHALVAESAPVRRIPGPEWRPGPAGSLAHDARAARLGHPVYPTARARRGLSRADLRAHAPEHAPTFGLRWLALPRERLTWPADLPAWWPTCAALGLAEGLDADHVTLPVHPLTWRGPLAKALADTGLAAEAVHASAPRVPVTPTLSMRTVAVLDDPATHLKLPLPTATLGTLNRRTLAPGTLVDGAASARLLAEIAAREPAFAGRVLHADEASVGHADHASLGFLVRRMPTDLTDRHLVVVAALCAPGTTGRPLLVELADRHRHGDALGLFADYLDLLLRWHTTLWLRYGIALESHQQNVSLVLDPAVPGPAGVALLYRDNDGLRIDPAVLADGLGAAAARAAVAAYADPRIAAAGPHGLADLYTTVTVHLCAGAPAFALADAGVAPLRVLLELVRDTLADSVRGLEHTRDAPVLRARVLTADRLPVKAMLTAGTLLPKARTGAADINKFYVRTGPNYLRDLP